MPHSAASAPALLTYYAQTMPGVEQIAWLEVRQRFPHATLKEYLFAKERNGILVFDYDGPLEHLLELRTVEDVFLLALSTEVDSRGRGALQEVTRAMQTGPLFRASSPGVSQAAQAWKAANVSRGNAHGGSASVSPCGCGAGGVAWTGASPGGWLEAGGGRRQSGGLDESFGWQTVLWAAPFRSDDAPPRISIGALASVAAALGGSSDGLSDYARCERYVFRPDVR